MTQHNNHGNKQMISLMEKSTSGEGEKCRDEQLDRRTANVEELQGSVLGTHEYWQECYRQENRNYKDHGDVGEVWFEEDSQIRIINWMEQHLEDGELLLTTAGRSGADRKSLQIVDIGCGNGMFLIELARLGYRSLSGVDYSPEAIRLATNIAKDQGLASISFRVLDLLDMDACREYARREFDIVHDKGTYDTISLYPGDTQQKRRDYCRAIRELLQPNGLLIITSCNWSEDELVASFSEDLELFATIPTPTFKFGGKVGNLVTSSVFKRRNDN